MALSSKVSWDQLIVHRDKMILRLTIGTKSFILDVSFHLFCKNQQIKPVALQGQCRGISSPRSHIGEKKVYFYFFERHERYNQEVLSHSFICLPLPYMEGIVLICNMDLYCVITI